MVEQADLMEQRYSPRRRSGTKALHHLPALRVRRGVPGTGRGTRVPLQLQPARDPHLRGHRDVRDFRSDLGVLYLSTFNESVIGHALSDANLSFNLPFTAQPHVFVSDKHP